MPVRLVRAITFECLDLQTSANTSSEYLDQGRVPRSWGQGQGHTSVTKYTHAAGLLRVKGILSTLS